MVAQRGFTEEGRLELNLEGEHKCPPGAGEKAFQKEAWPVGRHEGMKYPESVENYR